MTAGLRVARPRDDFHVGRIPTGFADGGARLIECTRLVLGLHFEVVPLVFRGLHVCRGPRGDVDPLAVEFADDGGFEHGSAHDAEARH